MLSIRSLAIVLEPCSAEAPGDALYRRFRAEPDTLVIAALDAANRPVGLVERNAFMLKMGAEYGRALWARRPISCLMDENPLVVEAAMLVADFMKSALSDRPSDLLRGFIVTEQGRYVGVGTPLGLLHAIGEENRRSAESNADLARNLAAANVDAQQARSFMSAVIDTIPAMVLVKSAVDHTHLLVNRGAEAILGFSREELIGRTTRDLFPADEAEQFMADDLAAVNSGELQVLDREVATRKDGSTVILRTKKLAIPDESGRPKYVLTVADDITEQVRAGEQIARMAHYDSLTDLPNRVLFRQDLDGALGRMRRTGEAVAVLCIDLDRFKTVNDTLGHPIGDALLKAATQRLLQCVRANDTVSRLGGDEFAVVQTGLDSAAAAGRLAGRIVQAMAEPFEILGHQVVIGASVGIAMAPSDADTPDDLLKMADMALYRVKEEGRGGFHYFERDMDQRLKARRALELDLRRALPAGEFELHYQPLFSLGQARVSGCEALIRWRHPDRGLVSPADFIPLAEEIGLIVPLGEWVIRQACRDAARWPGDIKIAINISPAQFRSPGLVEVVVSALTNAGLAADRLELEITETVLLHDNAGNLKVLHQLRGLGVRISMDDFGTGYSSLSYLRSFPFDKIKIDQSFVRDLLEDADARAIVRAVTSLGASLGIVTTAEGVETIAQLERLREEGCQEIQGYLVSRPQPLAELHRMLGWPAVSAAVAEPARLLSLGARDKAA